MVARKKKYTDSILGLNRLKIAKKMVPLRGK